MAMTDWTLQKFVDETFSKAPIPGGGGVAAVVGSIGAALGGMTCNLTTGKKKYAQYEEDIQRLLAELDHLTQDILRQADKDAQNFAPLAACYSMPNSTEEEKALKNEKMQACLLVSISAPIEIVKLCYRGIEIMEELLEKGSRMLLSDVGCGVLCLKSGLQCGWLNVLINLSSIKDDAYVDSVREELLPLVTKGEELADRIYHSVAEQL